MHLYRRLSSVVPNLVEGKEMQVGMLKLDGLRGAGCAVIISDALKAVKGVDTAEVSFEKAKASVTYDESQVSLQRLKVAVEEAGYGIAKPVHGEDGACCGGCGG